MERTLAERLDSLVAKFPPRQRRQARECVRSVRDRGAASLGSLIDLAQSPEVPKKVRANACWVLGRLGEKRAVSAMLKALSDEDPTLFWEAATALSLVRGKRAVMPLIAILGAADTDEHRVAAAYALGFSHDTRAVEPLMQILDNHSESSRLRGHAAEGLAYLGDGAGVQPLIRATADPSPEVRYWAAFALGQIGDRRALPRLRKLAVSDNGRAAGFGAVRDEAASAIAHIKNQQRDLP